MAAAVPDPSRPGRTRTTSTPKHMIDSAMAAFSGGPGTCTQPNVAAARVMLCATVKAVMVLTSIQRSRTISSRPRTNSR